MRISRSLLLSGTERIREGSGEEKETNLIKCDR